MAIATNAAEPNGPLSQSQQQEVAAAHDRARTIRKVAAVAKFNGWMTGIAAACSAPFALFSLPGFLATAGLSLVAYNKLKGRRRLLRFDQGAPAFLGWNQIGFLALITSYCIGSVEQHHKISFAKDPNALSFLDIGFGFAML